MCTAGLMAETSTSLFDPLQTNEEKSKVGSCLDCIIEGEFPVLDEAIFDIILLTLLFL
jgi:hypothetical protein